MGIHHRWELPVVATLENQGRHCAPFVFLTLDFKKKPSLREFLIGALAVLKAMMRSLTTLDPKVVVDTMSEEQRRAALAFLLPSRSGSGFLHDLRHVCGDLGRITAPTLILESKYDGSKDPFHAAYAADHIPKADLFVIPAESHLMWFSSYNEIIEEKMRAFLLTSQVSG
jgi:pimeloyl-ACP methyl ester carboxylesterase